MIFLAVFFIFVIILFGLLAILPYEEKRKKGIMQIYAIIYNLIFGFYDLLFLCAFTFVYAGSLIKDVIEFIIIYLLLRIPINILFKVRGKIGIKKYLGISILSTLGGLVMYFLILLPLDKLGINILAL